MMIGASDATVGSKRTPIQSHSETNMTDQPDDKTELEKSRDVISQLKEMRHYSKTNIEKLGEFWLLLDEELKQKENAKKIEALLTHQNTFHGALESMISDYEIECNRIENEAS